MHFGGGVKIIPSQYNFSGYIDDKADKTLSNVTLSQYFKDLSTPLSFSSGRYDNLTLKASGSKYIAPANGKYVWRGSLAGLGYMELQQLKNEYAVVQRSFSTGAASYALDIEAQKGDETLLTITVPTITTNFFRFIYAEGAKND